MKDAFPGSYQPSEEDFERLWKGGTFVFDTSVLLDTYRFSAETSDALLRVISDLSPRIWMPYQAGLEYHRNLPNVIAEEAQACARTAKDVGKLVETLESNRGNPFIDDKTEHAAVIENLKRLHSLLKSKEEQLDTMLLDNALKESIAKLFGGHIGSKPTQEKLEAIYTEGKKRYENSIPPGYDDKDKPSPQRYGDLVIWQEIIAFSIDSGTDVIFITSDRKSDCFLEVRGKMLGPRPELLEEFQSRSPGQLFYMYRTETFLERAREYLKATVPDDAVSEVKELGRTPSFVEQLYAQNLSIRNATAHIREAQEQSLALGKLLSGIPVDVGESARRVIEAVRARELERELASARLLEAVNALGLGSLFPQRPREAETDSPTGEQSGSE